MSGKRTDAWSWQLEELEGRTLPSIAPAGLPFQANNPADGTQQTQIQSPHSVAMDAQGDFVVTWSGQKQGSNGWNVYAQRYDAAGNPLGGEFQVNTSTQNDQEYSAVAMDAAGDFVVTWSSHNPAPNGWDVYAQRYDAAGNRLGTEFQVNTTTHDNQQYSAVAMDAAGDFVVTWQSHNQDGDGWGIYAQRYDAAGNRLGTEFLVNTTTHDNQEYSAVAMDAAGDFVVTWSSNNQDGSGWGVYAQRYDDDGNRLGTEFLVNTTTQGDQMDSSVAMDGQGNMLFAWSSHTGGDQWGIFAQYVSNAGAFEGQQLQVNTVPAHEQELPSVAMDAQGDALLTWSSHDQEDGVDLWNVSGQYLNPGGTPVGSEFQVNTGLIHPLGQSSVALTSPGNHAVVVWWSKGDGAATKGIFARQFTTSGAVSGTPEILVDPTSGLGTTEAGGQATFSVVLGSQPTADVTIPVSTSNPEAGVVSQTSLVFTPYNWAVPQTVTVSGVDDPVVNRDVSYTVSTGPATSDDPNYNHRSGATVSLTNRGTRLPAVPVVPVELRPVPADSGSTAIQVATNSGVPTPFSGPTPPANSVLYSWNNNSSGGSAQVTLPVISTVNFNSSGTSNARPSAKSSDRSGEAKADSPVEASTPASAVGATSPAKSDGSAALGAAPAQTAAPRRYVTALPMQLLNQELDRLGKQVEPPGWPRRVEATFVTAVVASVGYVLLGGKGAYWILSALSALTARPLWKQFDPIDILFAWEEERRRKRALHPEEETEEEAETLQSLVS